MGFVLGSPPPPRFFLPIRLCNLDWKEHVKTVSTKVSRAIGFLRHAKNILPIGPLKTLYSSILEPHFRYCCAVWGCCGTTDIDQLQKLQNRAARIVKNSSFDAPSMPLIGKLGWKTVHELIDQDSRLTVCKSINGLPPQYLHEQSIHRKLFLQLMRPSKCENRLEAAKETSINGQQ